MTANHEPQRAGGLRLIRAALLLIAVGVVLNSAGVALTFKLNGDRVDEINQERFRNTVSACEEKSGSNAAILAYLEALGAEPDSIEQASEFFPVLSDAECAAQARKRVTPNP